MSHAAHPAAEDRPGSGKGAVAAFLFLAAWLGALVGDAATPISSPLGRASIGSLTIVDSAPAPRFAAKRATEVRAGRPDARTADLFDDGATEPPPAFAALPLPGRPEAPRFSLSSDPLAAHIASGFNARAPPRG